jgi:putative DNA-invertase from lambdoid prophage Rac
MSADKKLRARMYLRVSMKPRKPKRGDPLEAPKPEAPKRGQTVENQRPDLEQIARVRGFEMTGEYVEAESTKKKRPEYEAMLEDARRGAFDLLLLWALDRFGRDTLGNMQAVAELDRLGIRIVSLQESWLDTTGPTRTLLVAIFSWVAEQERERRGERTRAGLERVRTYGSRSGRPIGRPRRLDAETVASVLRLAAEGESQRDIAVAIKLPRRTVRRALEAAPGQNPLPPMTPNSDGESTPSAPQGQ